MKATLYKWANGKWRLNPTDGTAYSSEIIYAKGDETIDAGTGEDACRLILYYDEKNEKAAILHTNDTNGDEYRALMKVVESKKFSTATTQVYLCGDEGNEELKSWNDDIESDIKKKGYNLKRISKGKQKNISINPGQQYLSITDSSDRDLLF